MASFLTNPPPGPRLRACVSFNDAVGNPATGGVWANAFADLTGYLAKGDLYPSVAQYSCDNLIAAGVRWLDLFWLYGQTNAPYIVGSYPLTYPGASAGSPFACTPIDQVTHLSTVGSSSYLDQIVLALNTAGRKGSLYGMAVYSGAVPAKSAIDTATLDGYDAIARLLGATAIYDGQQALDYATAECPPTLMGSTVCAGWWSADSGAYTDAGGTLATNGQTVQQWNDRSGNGRNFSQATANNRPAYVTGVVNGHPVLRFDGTKTILKLAAAIAPAGGFTIFVVHKTTGDQMLLAHSTLNRQVRIGDSGNNRLSYFEGTNQPTTVTLSTPRTSWNLVVYGNTGAAGVFYEDGNSVALFGGGTAGAGMSIDSCGNFMGGAPWTSGDIAEIIICTASLTTNQRQLIEGYLAQKYALTVSGTPTLPHRAHVDRRLATYGVKSGGEAWDIQTEAGIAGWLTKESEAWANAAAGTQDPTQFRADVAWAAPSSWQAPQYIKANGVRPVVLLANNGSSVSDRIAAMNRWMARGCDVSLDFGGFTTAQIKAALSLAQSAGGVYLRNRSNPLAPRRLLHGDRP